MKKLGLTAIALNALLLSGCGGGGSDTNISDKKYIVIFQSVTSGICESNDFRNQLKSEGFEGLITEETNIDTTCSTYGKTNNGSECAMEFMGTGNVNCVVGVNSINGQGKQAKLSGDINLYDVAEITFSESF